MLLVVGCASAASRLPALDAAVDAKHEDAAPVDGPMDSAQDAAVMNDAHDDGALPEPDALCRGPKDPGCAECRDRATGVFRSGSASSDRYDVLSLEPRTQVCRERCLVCAACTYLDELTLRALEPRRECVCSGVRIADACFDSSGCECFCETLRRLSAACPDVDLP